MCGDGQQLVNHLANGVAAYQLQTISNGKMSKGTKLESVSEEAKKSQKNGKKTAADSHKFLSGLRGICLKAGCRVEFARSGVGVVTPSHFSLYLLSGLRGRDRKRRWKRAAE